jgi:hypothetical protein
MRKSLLLFIFCLVLGFGRKADAQQMPFSKLLSDNRYALVVQNGEMSGPGAPLLKRLLGEAQFVAIGEEHGTREVPQFVWATCRAMAPGGLDAMAIEAGPLVTAKLQKWTSEEGGSIKLAAFERQYPDSIAFFYWQQEFDLLSHCQQTTASRSLHLWGLDQEFLGSPTFILQEILATHPDPKSKAISERLLAQCSSDIQKAFASGNWMDACMFRVSASNLTNLQAALTSESNVHAQELAAALVKTQHIYSSHESGHRYEANRERALLLKHNFLTDYDRLSKSNGRSPRVLLKFGGNHLYKGFDETELNDLGNFVTEFADGLGSNSLHIEVLGVRGENEEELGPGKPDKAVVKTTEDGPLVPVYAMAYPDKWTVFDLRPLRSEFDNLGHVDRELERLIFGYDVLVLIPQVTAQAAIQ